MSISIGIGGLSIGIGSLSSGTTPVIPPELTDTILSGDGLFHFASADGLFYIAQA